MKRFYIFKDGTMQSSTATKELAIDLIRQYQKLETHPLLRSQFSIIAGEEEFIPYPSVQRKPSKRAGERSGDVPVPPLFTLVVMLGLSAIPWWC